ncbi:CobW family GTP-binding protein [Amantichitinum ursilacus]|uniref:Putative metal chaperone YciC n=1 Tax=Amantichitinum ursilacus TaxID=857265 RepID=A0A0N0XHS8_9NEIS|nr:CobW family GTP-binding protein [Amantichitinum ursilacus]KPC49351.1 putative metal chaperone YciC [Amantichitinum ursilacus]
MTETSAARIPVNLITGFLGVGKTTAVANLLAGKPADEFWAVVVNEFGEVGIDGATLSVAGDGLQVAEVPGGCICCTTSPMLRVNLNKLVQGRRPDRILIEPSGLGHPAGIIDLLRDPFMAKTFEVRAVLTLVDARHLEDARYTRNETWRDQIELADVLVLNKVDLADAEQIDRAEAMGRALFPPKLAMVSTRKGVIDPALLDAPLDPARWISEHKLPEAHQHAPLTPSRKPASVAASAELPQGDLPVRKTQSSLGSHACGWVFSDQVMFDSGAIADLFEAMNDATSLDLVGLQRAKGVFQTERDWYRFDWVDGYPSANLSAWRRDTRFELIVAAEQAPDWQAVEQRLLAARIRPAANASA